MSSFIGEHTVAAMMLPVALALLRYSGKKPHQTSNLSSLLLFSIAYYIKTNSRSAITYETEQLKYKTIEDKIVATGSVVPEDEVNIVPQISGIIQEIFVDEGDQVKAGDLLAKIKVTLFRDPKNNF